MLDESIEIRLRFEDSKGYYDKEVKFEKDNGDILTFYLDLIVVKEKTFSHDAAPTIVVEQMDISEVRITRKGKELEIDDLDDLIEDIKYCLTW